MNCTHFNIAMDEGVQIAVRVLRVALPSQQLIEYMVQREGLHRCNRSFVAILWADKCVPRRP